MKKITQTAAFKRAHHVGVGLCILGIIIVAVIVSLSTDADAGTAFTSQGGNTGGGSATTGSLFIGEPVDGGLAEDVLFVSDGGLLARSASLAYQANETYGGTATAFPCLMVGTHTCANSVSYNLANAFKVIGNYPSPPGFGISVENTNTGSGAHAAIMLTNSGLQHYVLRLYNAATGGIFADTASLETSGAGGLVYDNEDTTAYHYFYHSYHNAVAANRIIDVKIGLNTGTNGALAVRSTGNGNAFCVGTAATMAAPNTALCDPTAVNGMFLDPASFKVFASGTEGPLSFDTGTVTVVGDPTWIPGVDNNWSIGSNGNRLKLVRAVTITSGDLNLQDDTRDASWTIREESDSISVINRRTGKRYKMALVEYDGHVTTGECRRWWQVWAKGALCE